MPATSEASREALYSVLETEYGVTPDTPNLKRVRKTGVKLKLEKQNFQTEEANPQRQIIDFRHGNRQTGGDIGIELSYGSFDDILEAVLFSEDWAPRALKTATTISAAASDDSYNGTGLPIFVVGEKVNVTGFVSGGNNGLKTVVTSTATKLTVSEALTDEAAGPSVTLASVAEAITAGVTRRSYSLFRHFEDQVDVGAEPWHAYTGWVWGGFTLTLAPGGAIKGTFSGMGQDRGTGEEPVGAVKGVPTTSRMFDSFTGWLKEGGTNLAVATEITLTLDNGLQPLFTLFSATTSEPSSQRSNLTGQLTAHFKNAALLKKFADETPTSLEFRLIDKSGNVYQFTFPNVTYTGETLDTAAEGPIVLQMPFQAIYDATVGSQIQIQRIPA